MNMRKIFTTIMLISAPLALAACGEKAAEPEETVVIEETVAEEPAADAMAPAEDDATDAADDAADAAMDDAEEKGDATERGDGTERGSEEK